MKEPEPDLIEFQKRVRPVSKSGDIDQFVKLILTEHRSLKMETLWGSWLHEAATYGVVGVVKWLVEQGCDFKRKAGVMPKTPIGMAALQGHLDVVQYLHSVGAVLNPSLLNSAIYAYQTDVACYLINEGVDTSIVYGKEEGIQRADMLSNASDHGAADIVWLLKEKMGGAAWEPPVTARERESLKKIQTSIENGDSKMLRRFIADDPATLHLKTKLGSWLHLAAGHGQLDIFHWLLDQGLDMNERGGCFDAGPLNEAVSMAHPEAGKSQLKIVQHLLDLGVDLDVSTRLRNPLFTASHFSRDEAAEMLVDAGIDTTRSYDFYDDRKIDALTFAEEWFRPEIAGMLRQRLS